MFIYLAPRHLLMLPGEPEPSQKKCFWRVSFSACLLQGTISKASQFKSVESWVLQRRRSIQDPRTNEQTNHSLKMFTTTLAKKTGSQVCMQTRGYAGRVQIQSALPRRPLKKIRIGKARPAIYYKFNTQVELSDGSVITRRSQYPKDELRMITDQRNNPLWNPSKPDASLLDAESKGKLNKFKSKFAAFEQSGKSSAEVKAEEAKAEKERLHRLKTGMAAKKVVKEEDDFLEMLSSNYEEEKLGGNLAQKEKKKKN